MEWWIYVIIIAAVVALAIAALVIRTAVLNKKGLYLAGQVTSKLKSYSSLRRYKVLTGVRLPYRGGVKEISHVLIGIFGVIVVDTHHLNGELYGTADDKKWTHVFSDGKKEQLPNLALDLQEKVDAIRQAFAAQGIYRVSIDSINVVQNSEKKLKLYVASSLPVIRLNRLGAFLGKSKYDTDADVDMDKLAKILTSSSQN
ncbi:nuclease-related domain-containing protein [Acetanaerobacterium elongatum]|uniref:Nuclease-related domain-containing protein n=1 Tax=Acetanaerobacterium elongatum TaxID=258515 RepID=A0A1G9Z4J7_9FIRM|nr:nuclease-related domain-containing protein [Acetanaerobacterium elongatum]SDN16302.1 Nuclease-related domain-containing protein [Acetanaerobacterium elongatum]